ncbi:MAG TPA: M48 family peptidase, partial [Terriglobia bacterium]|nr:M48 family peptidase [Terriglobia bacterium]
MSPTTGAGALAKCFVEAHRHLRPRSPVPPIHAEFFPFAGLNHSIRRRSGRISARISDIFRDAPRDVVGAVAHMLLARLYRQRVDPAFSTRYRRYILSETIRRRAETARRERGRATRTSNHGRYVDLAQAFDRLNRDFFNERLPQPALLWSRVPSRSRLGRY